MLMYLLRGSLPWQGLGIEDGDRSRKYERIMDMKMDTAVSVLCRSDPPEFVSHLKYCRSLGYEDEPDYKYLLHLWKSALARKTSLKESDFKFDWLSCCTEQRRRHVGKRKRCKEEADVSAEPE